MTRFKETEVSQNIYILNLSKYIPSVSIEEIKRFLGYLKAAPAGIHEMIEDGLEKTKHNINCQAGYALYPFKLKTSSSIEINSIQFHPKNRIIEALSKAEEAVIFIVSLGQKISKWTSQKAMLKNPA